MAVQRQFNFLGQGRVDVPHLRLLESAVAGDFDALAGYIISGKQPLVVKGFKLDQSTVGSKFENLKVIVADSAILHYGASESGTIFTTSTSQAPEQLTSTNAERRRVLRLGRGQLRRRGPRAAGGQLHPDRVAFINSDTKAEQSRKVAARPRPEVPLRHLDEELLVGAERLPDRHRHRWTPTASSPRSPTRAACSSAWARAATCRRRYNVFAFSQRKDSPYFTTTSATDPFSGGDKDIPRSSPGRTR
jgi:hypothetical protein